MRKWALRKMPFQLLKQAILMKTSMKWDEQFNKYGQTGYHEKGDSAFRWLHIQIESDWFKFTIFLKNLEKSRVAYFLKRHVYSAEPPRAFGGQGKVWWMRPPASEASRNFFQSLPLDWLKNAFQSNSCSQIVKIFNWGSLDPAAQGQTAPPAPPPLGGSVCGTL